MQPPDHVNHQSGDRGTIACTQCGAPMPREMRFCRACGHRLGEGPPEYTETTRFPNVTAQTPRATSPYIPPQGGPMTYQPGTPYPAKRKRKLSGMTWIIIIIAALFVMGGALSALRKRGPRTPPFTMNLKRSYFGVNGFDEVAGGVTFDDVEPPGGPADKAGLVGGDIIQTFDGHRVTEGDEIIDLLRQTPIGKTVEITYLRDGELKKTQLTTISKAESDDLESAARNRPEGTGYFGFESRQTTRVADTQTKTYGVRLDWVQANRPADLFGLKVGDIITAWDDVPIRTGEELAARVRRAVPKSSVIITLVRDGQQMKIPVTIGRS